MGPLADVPAGVELELGAMVVVRSPERADDRDVVGTRADVLPPVADLEPALAVFPEAGVQTHQDSATSMRRVARDNVFQLLRVEGVLVGCRVDRLARESSQLGLGVEALDVADATTEKDPDDGFGLGRGCGNRCRSPAKAEARTVHRPQGQAGKAHPRIRQERSTGHARAAPRSVRLLSRHWGDLLGQRIVTKS